MGFVHPLSEIKSLGNSKVPVRLMKFTFLSAIVQRLCPIIMAADKVYWALL